VPRASDSTVLTVPTEERTKRAGGHSSVSVLPFRSSLLRMRTVALVSSSSLSPSAVGSGGVPTHLPKQASRNVRVCVPGLLLGVCYTALLHRVYSKRQPASAYLTQLSLNQSQSHTTRPGTHIPQKTHTVSGVQRVAASNPGRLAETSPRPLPSHPKKRAFIY